MRADRRLEPDFNQCKVAKESSKSRGNYCLMFLLVQQDAAMLTYTKLEQSRFCD